ncbi:hypothetical protein M8818_003526 [Zalaria obscura]|uniref:Uncharacterized protein n=1 Tax=Zalaria obscura TaxID=2024903 RepID=A0ACC3SF57_9PEZI
MKESPTANRRKIGLMKPLAETQRPPHRPFPPCHPALRPPHNSPVRLHSIQAEQSTPCWRISVCNGEFRPVSAALFRLHYHWRDSQKGEQIGGGWIQ